MSILRNAALSIAAVTASAFGGIHVASADTGAATADPNAAVVLRSGESPRAVAEHWTPARMRAARPAPEPRGGAASLAPPSTKLPEMSAPGSGSASAAVTAAATVSKSTVWSAHGTMPATTVGKLYYDIGNKPYECTASVISSANRSVVWTAGHCVSDTKGHWYSHFQFVPDYHDGTRPLGAWTWKKVSTPRGWKDFGDQHYDLAAIALNTQNGRKVADVTGSQGYHFNGGYTWDASEFGYPYDTHPKRSGITGQQLRYCAGRTWKIGLFNTWEGIHCDQGHGASGGPWLSDLRLGRGWGYLVGNTSNHPDDNKDEERSPHFGDDAVNVYNQVKNA